MTAQIEDSVSFLGQSYTLLEYDGEKLFIPSEHNIQPTAFLGTHCWSGYYLQYAILKDKLFLSKLFLALESAHATNEHPISPDLFGVKPSSTTTKNLYVYRFVRDEVLIPYSGHLLIGRNTSQPVLFDLNPSPSFYYYNKITELSIQNGVVTEYVDVSQAREEMQQYAKNYNQENICWTFTVWT